MMDAVTVLDALPALAWTALPDGRLNFVSRRWAEYTDLDIGEGHCHGLREVIHSDDWSPLLERWRAILAAGKAGAMEARIRCQDGQYLDFVIQASPVLDDTGQIVQWCGLGHDAYVGKHSAQNPRQPAPDFQSIVDSIPVPTAVTSPTGEVEGLNQLTLDYFGKSLDDLKGWKATDAVHPDDREQTVTALMKAHQEGDSYNVESRHLRSDHVYRWFNVRGFPLRDSQGHILRWFHLLIDIDDRKRAEVELAISERKLQLIVDTIPTMTWSATPDGTADFFNRHYLSYLGVFLEQATGWGWVAAVHPDDLSGLVATWQNIIASGEAGETKARLRRHDGAYRWFLFRVNPLRDEAGDIAKWYGTNVDIDDLKRAENELRRSEGFLSQTQRLTRTGSTWWNVGTSEFYLSEEGLRVLECPNTIKPEPELIRSGCHPDDLAFVQEEVDRSTREGCDMDFEYRLLMPDGSVKHVHVVAQNVGVDPRQPEFAGAVTDITERKRAAEALERSEAFLAEGQHLARMGNFSLHLSTGNVVWSEPLYSLYEFRPDTPITLDLIATRMHPDDRPPFHEMLERSQRGDVDFECQYRICMPDRSIKYLHLIAHLAKNHVGESSYIGAVLDITRQHHAEESLSKARSQLMHVTRVTSLGALTASIAHEVNQPLSGIITNASACLRMLAAEPPNIECARETAWRTIRDGNRAADVIARLRALFSKRAVTIEPVDLNEATRDVTALLRSDLVQANVILRTELAGELPLVGGDRIQLQQVIMNLLRNAVDAMSDINDRSRHLTVRTEYDENYHIRVSVRDTGAGFRAEDAERVFESFFTTKSDGMGIGLSVSRSIIEHHGGHLWATPNDGPGVTFAFSIPAHT